MRSGKLLRQFDVAVMRHRRVPINKADLGARVLRSILSREKNLDALHRVFGHPVVTVKMGGRPHHPLVAVKAGVEAREKILVDVFEIDTPGIAGFLEDVLDLDLDAALPVDAAAVMLDILDLLFEKRATASLYL